MPVTKKKRPRSGRGLKKGQTNNPFGLKGERKPLEQRVAERKAERERIAAAKKTRAKAAKKRRADEKKAAAKARTEEEVLKTRPRSETLVEAMVPAQAVAPKKADKPLKSRQKVVKDTAVRRATPAEIELAKRKLQRRHLLPFIQKFNRRYNAGWVHEHICAQLERFTRAVENEESPRLMIFMPPRHGKSEIASKNYPAWLLGKHPEWEIIASSYAVSLPVGFSRKVQATIQDPAYQQLFPDTKLHPKAQSAEAWMTTAEGGYVAAGVGGGITGKGAHVFIIDDPVKDAEEADSDTQREKVWAWWGSTAKTRLAPGGGVLVIQTRWHDDDLSGRMIQQRKDLMEEFEELIARAKHNIAQAKTDNERRIAEHELATFEEEYAEIDDWEIIVYPAIAVEDEYVDEHGILVHQPAEEQIPQLKKVRSTGEALHNQRYPLGRLRNMKRSMQPRHWSALYQQNPVPDEGIYFTKDMIRFTDSIPPPEHVHMFSAWDLAAGEKQQNDFTVGVVGGLDYQGRIIIYDLIRIKADIHKVAAAIMATYKRWPMIQEIGVEKGVLELALMPELTKLMEQERLFPVLNHELRPVQDKWVRARPLQGRMQVGNLLFPHGQAWTDTAIQELLRFPGGLHDDIVDALAWLVRMIGNRKEPDSPTAKNTKSWRDRLKSIQQGGRISNTPMGA